MNCKAVSLQSVRKAHYNLERQSLSFEMSLSFQTQVTEKESHKAVNPVLLLLKWTAELVFTLAEAWPPEHSLLLTPPASRSVNCTRQGQLVLQRTYSESSVSKKNHRGTHTTRYFGWKKYYMNLWINMELPKTGGEDSKVLIHGMCIFSRMSTWGSSYQIYSAAKGIILKLECDTVNIDISFFASNLLI